jgi:hypothetical protein
MEQEVMQTAVAILIIRSNWPDERYMMLREALTKAIAALEDNVEKFTSTNSRVIPCNYRCCLECEVGNCTIRGNVIGCVPRCTA